jgi:hypothetical protein
VVSAGYDAWQKLCGLNVSGTPSLDQATSTIQDAMQA